MYFVSPTLPLVEGEKEFTPLTFETLFQLAGGGAGGGGHHPTYVFVVLCKSPLILYVPPPLLPHTDFLIILVHCDTC